MENLGKTVTYLALVAISVVVSALLVSHFWAWFVAPVFGAPLLTGAQAAGIGMVAQLLKSAQKEEYKGISALVLRSATVWCIQLVYLALGFVIHLFVQAGW